ncbi:unnamed protein product [Clonostachys chloroleuca]|uniref:C6 transcription factor n=1 Tax=Clonostachys chloroleuca TaxID=1926264 RepID=A0AA35LPY2_9HYPO|nr:unnamed protein product [Clonostachys chloroleuca]
MGGSHKLPSPPAEESKPSPSRKTSSSSKSAKPVHRVSKRASSSAATTHHHDQVAHSTDMDGRHRRVWKACERCRMKKTKAVCTAGVRKKMEYKQLPRGYVEVLENTRFALIATVHKLYSMVRNSQQWELGEPELNDRAQPVIHDIAQKLGCIRPNSDIDLPVHSVFPEDERGIQELAAQLEEQQRLETETPKESKDTDSSSSSSSPLSSSSSSQQRTERTSSSKLDHSDFEQDYRTAAFGSHNNHMTLSPQSSTTCNTDFELGPASGSELDSQPMFPSQSPQVTSFPSWTMPSSNPQVTTNNNMPPMSFIQNSAGINVELQRQMMLNQGILEPEFAFIKPNHVLSCPNPEVMMGMGDPMIFSGYENERSGL